MNQPAKWTVTTIAAIALAAGLGGWGGASFAQGQAGRAPGEEAHGVYVRHCGMCHQAGGMGTNMLALRQGPERAQLEARDDLPAAYIELIVRNGLNSMPPITRADVTEEELAQITAWLTRNNARGDGRNNGGDQ